VNGFGGMKEMAWCACRSKSRAYLLSDYASFADAADYARAAAFVNHPASAGKRRIDNRLYRNDSISLSFDYFPRIFKINFHLFFPG
jgi:hypothetical protein